MLRRYLDQLGDILSQVLSDSAQLVRYRIRHAVVRGSIMVAGLGIALIGVAILAAAMFFAFADLQQYGQAALYSGLITTAFGAVTIIIGSSWG